MTKTAQTAPLKNGTRIAKTNSAPEGDIHPDGALGTVYESLGPADNGGYGYMVGFDQTPGRRVFVAGTRLKAFSD